MHGEQLPINNWDSGKIFSSKFGRYGFYGSIEEGLKGMVTVGKVGNDGLGGGILSTLIGCDGLRVGLITGLVKAFGKVGKDGRGLITGGLRSI